VAINTISSPSSALPPSSSSGNAQSAIAALERQLVQVEKKIAQVSRDQTLSAEAKQETLALYQAQAQMIEAQIQQLQQQQQQQRLARTAAEQQTKDVQSGQQKSGSSKIDVVA
jgi:hypothetical protein